jgi:large subunit ribosomal protein L32e
MAIKKRSHPKFLRPNYGRTKRSRVKLSWRRPRGIDNKKRLKLKYMGASPSIGYGQPSAIKHKHPQGKPEVLIQSPSEVKGLKDVVVRIASGVGKAKRQLIIKLCEAAGLHVVNKGKQEESRKQLQAAGQSPGQKQEAEAKGKEAKVKAEDESKKVQEGKDELAGRK